MAGVAETDQAMEQAAKAVDELAQHSINVMGQQAMNGLKQGAEAFAFAGTLSLHGDPLASHVHVLYQLIHVHTNVRYDMCMYVHEQACRASEALTKLSLHHHRLLRRSRWRLRRLYP